MLFENRNTEQELRYFASDLNKYINQELPKKFTTINIDCLTFKRRDKILRIIEYKHGKENLPDTQSDALEFLSRCTPPSDTYSFGVFVVRGDSPDDIVIRDVSNKITYELQNKKDFDNWLACKVELSEIEDIRVL